MRGDLSEVCIWEIFRLSRWVEVMGIIRDPGCDPRLFLFNWQILEFLLFCKLVNLKYFRLLVYRYHVLGANLRSSVCLRWILDVYRLSLYAPALSLFLQNHSANWFFFCGEPFRWLESDLYWFIIYHSFKPKLMISGAIYVVLPSRGSVLSEPFYCEAGAKDYTVS